MVHKFAQKQSTFRDNKTLCNTDLVGHDICFSGNKFMNNKTLTGGFPSQRASNAASMAMSWRRHLIISWWTLFCFTRNTHGYIRVACTGNLMCFLPCLYLGAWWRHQMETFSALLAICAGIHRSPVNSPHRGQWHGALTFSLICVWKNDWVNNREAGDLRRYRTHYGVIVMCSKFY